jgi:hypothetical protein
VLGQRRVGNRRGAAHGWRLDRPLNNAGKEAIGRETADRWIQTHFDAIGHRSTIDVKETFL